jgi:hypothetical protein
MFCTFIESNFPLSQRACPEPAEGGIEGDLKNSIFVLEVTNAI